MGSVAVSWSAVCFSCSAAHQKFAVVVAFGWNTSSHLETRDPLPLHCAQFLATLKHTLFSSYSGSTLICRLTEYFLECSNSSLAKPDIAKWHLARL